MHIGCASSVRNGERYPTRSRDFAVSRLSYGNAGPLALEGCKTGPPLRTLFQTDDQGFRVGHVESARGNEAPQHHRVNPRSRVWRARHRMRKIRGRREWIGQDSLRCSCNRSVEHVKGLHRGEYWIIRKCPEFERMLVRAGSSYSRLVLGEKMKKNSAAFRSGHACIPSEAEPRHRASCS